MQTKYINTDANFLAGLNNSVNISDVNATPRKGGVDVVNLGRN
jgi:hypothetical protein